MFYADRINQDILKDIQIADSDLILRPIVQKINWYNFYQFKKIVRYGEKSALANIKQIKKVIRRLI